MLPSSANASPGRGLTAPPVSMPDTCSNATSSWVFALGVPPSSPAHVTAGFQAPVLACVFALGVPPSSPAHVTAGFHAPVLACVFALGVPPSSPAHEHSRASSACSGMRLRARRAALLACARHSRVSCACSGMRLRARRAALLACARHSRVSCACSGMRLRARRAALLACPRAQQGVKRLFWHASSRSACRLPRLPTSTAGRQAPVLACVFALGVPPSSPAHGTAGRQAPVLATMLSPCAGGGALSDCTAGGACSASTVLCLGEQVQQTAVPQAVSLHLPGGTCPVLLLAPLESLLFIRSRRPYAHAQQQSGNMDLQGIRFQNFKGQGARTRD